MTELRGLARGQVDEEAGDDLRCVDIPDDRERVPQPVRLRVRVVPGAAWFAPDPSVWCSAVGAVSVSVCVVVSRLAVFVIP